MTTPAEDIQPTHESHASGSDFADAVADLPRLAAEQHDQVAIGEVSMPLRVGDEEIEVSPRELELVPDAEDHSRFTAFIKRHKKETILLGSVTTAAVLAGVAAIRYTKKKK